VSITDALITPAWVLLTAASATRYMSVFVALTSADHACTFWAHQSWQAEPGNNREAGMFTQAAASFVAHQSWPSRHSTVNIMP